MKKLTKKDLINAVYENSALSKQAIEQVVDTFLETLVGEVEQGNQVRVFELGTFSVQTRCARTGRNPATGESVAIPEKRVPKLVFNQAITKRINK